MMGGAPEMPAGDASAEDESALLAVPPGSRNSPRVTPGARDKKYQPVKVDKRPAGARNRHFASLGGSELGHVPARKMHPGWTDMKTLAGKRDGTGIYESDAPIYSFEERNEEDKLFEVNQQTRLLIEQLDRNIGTPTENEDEDQAQ